MSAGSIILLNADDYAMTEGVSAGIEQLAEAGAISSTSAMVTTRHWTAHAKRLAALRDRIAAGLHLNLTLGAPLTAMRLAADGRLPEAGAIVKASIAGRLDRGELEAEIAAQIAAFRDSSGYEPDFIDGHQHVHALPIVRDALIAVLTRRFPTDVSRPLVRDPASGIGAIVRRGRATAKAATVAWLSRGFGPAVRAAGFATNDTFAGFSAFGAEDVAVDFASYTQDAGPLHLVMCHPGLIDDELARIDPVVARRRAELDHLLTKPFDVWRPQRVADGAMIDWQRVKDGGA